MNEAASRDWPIPARLNLALSIAGWPLAAACLWLGSHAANGWELAAACIGFALVNNMLFSLLHEAVHGVFHPNPRVNDWFGRVCAAFFPTGFLVQRVCHLGHHRRNRTDVELYDYCPPHTSMWLARFRLGCLLTGFYWLSVPLGCLLYILGVFRLRLFRERVAGFYGMQPLVEDVCQAPARRVAGDILFSLAVQTALFLLLDLRLAGWLACYWSFALLWCSMQYSTHAWTPRDVRNGAWNLRTNRLARAIFLNYHDHLAHHRHPRVPWIHLPRLVTAGEVRPAWWRIYLSLWRGPRPTLDPGPPPLPVHWDAASDGIP
jgi:fatty acid desaturase